MTDTPEPEPAQTETKSRLAVVRDVVLVRLRFIGLLVAVLLVAAYWDDLVAHAERLLPHDRSAAGAAADVEYFCPMHVQVVRDAPAKCPICGMPLSERRKGGGANGEGGPARVQFSPYRIAQGGIRTSTVAWMPLEREIRASAVVEADERRTSRVAARYMGRVVATAAGFRGARVTQGQPLLTLYSADVHAAEEALVSATRTLADAGDRATERDRTLAAAARARLVAMGLSAGQVDEIARTLAASPVVEVLAPVSGIVTEKFVVAGDEVEAGMPLVGVADFGSVWITAAVPESDLALVAEGRALRATATAYPGETFEGAVTYVASVVDSGTRTAAVRADVANAHGRLRPGMSVAATLVVPLVGVEPFASMPRPAPSAPHVDYWCPMHPDVVSATPGTCPKCGGMELERREVPGGPGPRDVLAVPESAVIDTGTRRVVYVERSPGVFDAREVVVGARAGAHYPVIRGLTAGERVATAGAFLIDAETRLDPAAAGAYFGATGTTAPPAGDRR